MAVGVPVDDGTAVLLTDYFSCCVSGDIDKLSSLLPNIRELKGTVNPVDAFDESALAKAVYWGRVEIVKYFVNEHQINVNRKIVRLCFTPGH
jgi:hypothetical protein